MSTPTATAADDSIIEKKVVSGRRPNWWHLPTALTVLGVLELVAFALRIPGGETSTFRVVPRGGIDAGGTVPGVFELPAAPGSIALGILCLVIAGVFWGVQATATSLPRLVRPVLLAVFGLSWVLGFLFWTDAGSALDLSSLLRIMIVFTVPIAFGALSGVLSERSGVINIAIEGQLLFGAFGAALFGSMFHSAWVGLVAAPLVALGMGALLGLFAIGHRVQQIIVGVVLNVLALGLTTFFLNTVMRQNPQTFNTPLKLPAIRIPVLADLPLVGPALFNQTILVYLMWIIVVVLTVALFRTRWGLRVRSVGEHPRAADTVGINVNRTRWKNVLLGSAVAGLGGASLTIGIGVGFEENMSAGKGYIGLAAMILGRYHPVGALAAALLFALADSLQLSLGTLPPTTNGGSIPSEFLIMLPYVVTLFAVAGVVGRVRVPAADGEPYVQQ